MSFCPACGNQIPEDNNFCGGCGTAVASEAAVGGDAERQKASPQLLSLPVILAAVIVAVAVVAMYIASSRNSAPPADSPPDYSERRHELEKACYEGGGTWKPFGVGCVHD